MTFSVLPLLVVMAIAIAGMPTNVFQICRWEIGTLAIDPWQSKLTALPIARRIVSMARRFREWCRLSGGLPAAAAAAIVIIAIATVLSGHVHGSVLMAIAPALPGASALKDARQAVADVDQRIAANATAAADLDREINALHDAVTAGKKAMTAEQQTQLAELRARKQTNADFRATLLEQKADSQARLTEATAANERERAVNPADDADANASTRAAAGANIIVGLDLSAADPKRGFKDHRDFLKAVMDVGRGRKVDKRLMPLRAAQGSDEAGEYSDPAGGFLVPAAIAPGILSIAPEDDVLASLVTNVPMQAPTVAFNARVDKNHASSVSGGFQVTRHPETVDASGTRVAFEQVTLTANEEFGLAFASERIISDSPQSFVAIIQAGMNSEYVANAMNERINGTGAGERQGALNAGCRIPVAKENGQAAATIVKENIDKMAARCWRYGRAVWLANQNTRPQLKSLVQVVGVGGNAVPYFVTEGAPAGFDGMLDGRPLVFTEFAKTIGTEGDLILLVPSEYLEGEYQSEQYAESIHVRFVAAERAFRFYRRNDGQWWWRSALTPKNGSTLSPVVTLAVRA